jgi:dihydroneopterin aldolase
MSDILRIQKMVFHGRHGLFPEERKLGQKYEVDVEIRADLTPRAVVDYTQVYDHVEAIVTGETYELVEALTERIAASLVERFGLPEVLVRVRKPAPPFRGHFDGIEVEVTRRGRQG